MKAVPERWPAGYRLRVRGHLDDHWSAWFADLALVRHGDGTTTLSGRVADQAELHGMLAKIRDLGVTLLTVETLDSPPCVNDHTSPSTGQ